MLLTDDVVYLAAEEGVFFVDEAILAEVLSPCDDEPAKLYADVGSAQGRLGA
jgi:hypothetical protein